MEKLILNLRQEGKSYREIADIVGCGRMKVEWICNPKCKEIQKIAARKYRAKQPLSKKISNFHTRTSNRVEQAFSLKEFSDKIGKNPICFLTGVAIDLTKPETYSIDHLTPVSRGGTNALENAVLVTKRANQCKTDQTFEELISFCFEVLNHHKKL